MFLQLRIREDTVGTYCPFSLVGVVNRFCNTGVTDIKGTDSDASTLLVLSMKWSYFDCFYSGFVNDKTATCSVENGKAFRVSNSKVEGDYVSLEFIAIPYHYKVIII